MTAEEQRQKNNGREEWQEQRQKNGGRGIPPIPPIPLSHHPAHLTDRLNVASSQERPSHFIGGIACAA